MRLAALKGTRIRHVGSGQDAGHVVVVDETGQAWSWGNNEHGQLGQGDTRHRSDIVKHRSHVCYVTLTPSSGGSPPRSRARGPAATPSWP